MRYSLLFVLVATVKGISPRSHRRRMGPPLPLILVLRLT